MKETKVKIELDEEKPKKEKFDEERENTKLRLENSKLQIDLLKEKVSRLESQKTQIIEQPFRSEDLTPEFKKDADVPIIKETSLLSPEQKSKEVSPLKKKRESKGILLILSKIGMVLGVMGLSFSVIYFLILRGWRGIIWQISLPIGIISSLILGIAFYLIILRKKKAIELKYCPKCNYNLSKGKIIESETEIKQLYKCLNPNCDYIDSVEFEK